MWESRWDFQRVWEAGFLAFHAFHTLSFPWPAFRPGDARFSATSTSAMGRTRKEVFVVIVVDECFGDYASFQNPCCLMRGRFTVSEYCSKQSGSVSRAFRPRIRRPRRRRRQRPRPRVPSSPLRFQPIHPRQSVLLRNVDLLRRNASDAGSRAVSATGIVRLRERPSQRQHLFVDLGVKP